MMEKIKKQFNDLFGKKKSNETQLTHRELMLKEKEQATKDKKPWVGVLDTQVNKDNIRNGFLELDWNNEFIEQLLDAGYSVVKAMKKLLILGLKILQEMYLLKKATIHHVVQDTLKQKI